MQSWNAALSIFCVGTYFPTSKSIQTLLSIKGFRDSFLFWRLIIKVNMNLNSYRYFYILSNAMANWQHFYGPVSKTEILFEKDFTILSKLEILDIIHNV